MFIFSKKKSYSLIVLALLISSIENISYASEDDPSQVQLHGETAGRTLLAKSDNTEELSANKVSTEVSKVDVALTKEQTSKNENENEKSSSNKKAKNGDEEYVERAPNLDLKDVVEEPLTPTSTKSITDPDGIEKLKKKNKDKKKDKTKTDQADNQKNDTKAEGKTDDISNDTNQEGTEQQSDDTKGSIAKTDSKLPEEDAAQDSNTAEPLIILDAEVTPGTSTRLAWSPASDIVGLAVPTPVLVVNGAHKGQTLCLTAAVHGDELNGIEIIRRVMYNIEPEKLHGKLIGIPIVNVLGFQRGSRYLPDRRDLNRFFPGDPKGSLASRIAYSLFNEVISHCDSLIDVHTGSMRRTNLPQIRANMSQPEVAKMVQDFDKTLVIHSPGSSGMLRSAANSVGITSVTLEIGESLRIQEEQIKSGTYSVNSFMDRNGMYPRRFNWGKAQPAYYQSVWIRAQTAGILFSKSKLGDYVRPGQKLGRVTDPITNKVADIKSTVNGRIIGMAVDQVVMPGFAAYHIGIRTTEDEIIENVLDETPLPVIQEEINPEE